MHKYLQLFITYSILVLNYFGGAMKIILDKKQKLKKQLADSLNVKVVVSCRIHGPLTTTIGEFLDTGIVCKKVAEEMPAWHEDQIAYPLTVALMRISKFNRSKR